MALVIAFDGWDIFHLFELDAPGGWSDFAESLGFEAHSWNHVTQILLPMSEDLSAELVAQMQFDWASALIAPDFAQLYDEVFDYFAANGDRLNKLSWRGFEEFLASIFLAQGYRTILGPGSGDQGVDLRITENVVYGEKVTVVQAKRYGARRPIKLELVAAMLGTVVDQGADEGLLVTTSRFLPSAKDFAARNQGKLRLATSSDVAHWSEAIASTKSESVWLHATALSWTVDKDNVFVASPNMGGGYWPRWAVAVAETPTAARFARLEGSRTPMRPNDRSIGLQVPTLSTPLDPERTITARRVPEGYLADDGLVYRRWNREPQPYDYND